MSEEKKKAIDAALDQAGLQNGRVVIGTYKTSHEKGRVGVYFHYRFTERLANALIQLALQDKAVYEGLKDLRQNFDLIIAAAEGMQPIRDEELIH